MNLNLTLFSYSKVSLEKARLIVVDLVEDILFLANNNTQLDEYYNHLAWNVNDLHLDFVFIKKNGDFIEDDYIAMLFVEKGIVKYFKYDPIKSSLNHVTGETYQNAKGIVEHQKDIQNCELATGHATEDLFTD